MAKILDVTFWVSFISTMVHFFIWTEVAESADKEFVKQTGNILLLSGALAVISYFLMSSPPTEDLDE